MIKETVTVTEVIELLNGLVACDREAVQALFTNRVPCNEELADHPSVQVGVEDGKYMVGILGILNGLFGTDDEDWGAICNVSEVDNPNDGVYYFMRTSDRIVAIADPKLHRGKYANKEGS